MITFVIGGTASGKSDYALGLLRGSPGPALFVATGRARDFSFRGRIAAHRSRRGPQPPVLEVGADLPAALREARGKYGAVLVDSLDFWLYLCMADPRGQAAVAALPAALGAWDAGRLILVSCEIGLAPLPAAAEAREFQRLLGKLNQTVAARADEVRLVAAGLPLVLK